MSTRNNSNQLVNPMARQALDKFKMEAAQELNIRDDYKSGYWGNLTSRECGAVGGQMVKKMIEYTQNQMANGTNVNAPTSSQDAQNINLGNKAGNFKPQQ
ncbi:MULTISPECIES: alpha/beta-type small acid-soluble spore protein [unclassified Candidatus Frackibacter]|uniref:alpha/beta-type small acid-soluble spore protein n=1 Tax=unclassified Candidatus Frackibacter TaxID=2648818 RepID=UPI00087F8BED|nr:MULTISPECIES: alpha/beta-type small acid-soluble spore protein [unclassified Candidatus Frackibacter]SDC73541.1 Small, acid-soluble spore protein, alpha/beta type [Candidatus Frackibacter sp. WG11]SEM87699.1 Small, acid-soluble spore protein, alpha/beta type [Candidatus Frackibacter sp. WG12]SFL96879.1 Small, acid-soluble spore protein, alpha/beta type [Candidatus Frackibacter sp. WG13]